MQNGVGCASLGFDGWQEGEYPVLWNETIRYSPGISYTPNEDLCATIDTGCQRLMAIGLNTLKRLDQALPARDFYYQVRGCATNQFGTSWH